MRCPTSPICSGCRLTVVPGSNQSSHQFQAMTIPKAEPKSPFFCTVLPRDQRNLSNLQMFSHLCNVLSTQWAHKQTIHVKSSQRLILDSISITREQNWQLQLSHGKRKTSLPKISRSENYETVRKVGRSTAQMVPSSHVAEEWTSGILNPQPLLTHRFCPCAGCVSDNAGKTMQVRLHCSISAEEGNDVLREHIKRLQPDFKMYTR